MQPGDNYGKWTVLEVFSHPINKRKFAKCKCGGCGRIKDVYSYSLKAGKSSMCHKCHPRKHGLSRTREYAAWRSARHRCQQPGNTYFENGIRMCERWAESFEAFLSDVGPSNGLSLDRINNKGNYEPGNCRWVSMKVQANNRRNSKYGEYLDIARNNGIPRGTFYSRIRAGADPAVACMPVSHD